MSSIITDKDLSYFYFEMIKSSGAQTVLDVGMFLKKMGTVSRQALGSGIGMNVKLYGIDTIPEIRLAVYDKIYDEIITEKEFIDYGIVDDSGKEKQFDVASLLSLDEISIECKNKVWMYVLKNAKAIMTEKKMADTQVQQGLITGYYPVYRRKYICMDTHKRIGEDLKSGH